MMIKNSPTVDNKRNVMRIDGSTNHRYGRVAAEAKIPAINNLVREMEEIFRNTLTMTKSTDSSRTMVVTSAFKNWIS